MPRPLPPAGEPDGPARAAVGGGAAGHLRQLTVHQAAPANVKQACMDPRPLTQ